MLDNQEISNERVNFKIDFNDKKCKCYCCKRIDNIVCWKAFNCNNFHRCDTKTIDFIRIKNEAYLKNELAQRVLKIEDYIY